MGIIFPPIPNFIINFNSLLSAYFQDEDENKQMAEE